VDLRLVEIRTRVRGHQAVGLSEPRDRGRGVLWRRDSRARWRRSRRTPHGTAAAARARERYSPAGMARATAALYAYHSPIR